jgi:hypothetical protein
MFVDRIGTVYFYVRQYRWITNKEDWLAIHGSANNSWYVPSYEGLYIPDIPDSYHYVVWKKEG